jgi:uncharacterized membrane protein YcaP (DUF421 family)
MGLSELLSELRLKDVGDISEVDYAILEENGYTIFATAGNYLVIYVKAAG